MWYDKFETIIIVEFITVIKGYDFHRFFH